MAETHQRFAGMLADVAVLRLGSSQVGGIVCGLLRDLGRRFVASPSVQTSRGQPARSGALDASPVICTLTDFPAPPPNATMPPSMSCLDEAAVAAALGFHRLAPDDPRPESLRW
jgi:hypothetical protein